jgi:hypothetical protein
MNFNLDQKRLSNVNTHYVIHSILSNVVLPIQDALYDEYIHNLMSMRKMVYYFHNNYMKNSYDHNQNMSINKKDNNELLRFYLCESNTLNMMH